MKKSPQVLIKRILKISKRIFFGVFLFVYLLISLLNMGMVQSFLAAKASDFFSKEWKTEVSIESISVNIFHHVTIKNIFVRDLSGDTLAFGKQIHVSLGSLPSSDKISLRSVNLDGIIFNLKVLEEGINLGFIIDYFNSEEPKKPKQQQPTTFALYVSSLKIENTSVSIGRENIDDSSAFLVNDNAVDLYNICFADINLKMDGISIIGDSINANIQSLSARELSGFTINDLNGLAQINSKGISVQSLSVKTPRSDIKADLALLSDSWDSYKNFIDSVQMQATFHESSFCSLNDAVFWAPQIEGMDEHIHLKGKMNGPLSNINIRSLNLAFGKSSSLSLHGRIKGLPEIDQTVFDIYLDDFVTESQDLASFSLPTFLDTFALPSLLDQINIFSLQSEIHGKLSNLSASISLLTPFGHIQALSHLRAIDDQLFSDYKINMITEEIDIGTLFDIPWISPVNASLSLSGRGLDLEKMEIDSLATTIYNLKVNDNVYERISFDAKMHNLLAKGNLHINDHAIQLKMEANADLSHEILKAQLKGDILNAHIHKIGFFSLPDSNAILSTQIHVDIENFDIDNMDAAVNLQNSVLQHHDSIYKIPSFTLSLLSDTGYHILESNSNLLDLTLQGHFSPLDFVSISENFLESYISPITNVFAEQHDSIPPVIKTENLPSSASLSFRVRTKDLSMIPEIFSSDFSIASQTLISGEYNPTENLRLSLISPLVKLTNDMGVSSLRIQTKTTENNAYHVEVKTDSLFLSEELALKNVQLSVLLHPETSLVNLLFDDNKETHSTNGKFNLRTQIAPNQLNTNIYDSYISIEGEEWAFAESNRLFYAFDRLKIEQLLLNNGQQWISINGAISEKPEDIIDVSFSNVQLSPLNMILEKYEMNINGKINNHIYASGLRTNPLLTTDIYIDSLIVNDILFDKAEFAIANNKTLDTLTAELKFLRKGNRGIGTPLSIRGKFYPQKEDENLDFEVDIKTFDLKILRGLVSSFTSNLQGRISADKLKVTGTLSNPMINGIILTERGKIKIDFLNTSYDFNDPVYFENSNIHLKDFTLKDDNARETQIKGWITHTGFENIQLDLSSSIDNFILMNTSRSSESMYYGNVTSSATASVKGPLEHLNIDVDATTEPGTYLTIPINSKITAQRNSFITIGDSVNLHHQEAIAQSLPQPMQTSTDLNVKITVTPDAQLSIPLDFNQITGQVDASGKGNILLGLDSKENLTMSGGIKISSGMFRMNMMNIVSKDFILEPGGSLYWAGNPTDATIEVSAIYKLRTSLKNILGDEYDRNIDVQCVISLTGRLSSMKPKFDIRFPNIDSETEEKIFMEIDRNEEKEMIRQVASLLLLNRLYSNKDGYNRESITESLESNMMDIAFSQLSNLVSQLVPFMDVGVNYKQGNIEGQNQIGVTMSKKIGKFSINSNLGFDVGNTSGTATTNNSSGITGDLDLSWAWTPQLDIKIFNHSNANNFTKIQSPYTQGVALVYRKEFDSLKEFFFGEKKKKQNNSSPLP